MNPIPALLRVEKRLRQARIPVAELCREDRISPSSWVRWKNGTTTPRPDRWERVERTCERLLTERAGAAK